MARKYIAAILCLLLLSSNFAMCEEEKDVYNTSAPAATSAAAPTANSNARVPLIEVSVDALEITESNSNVLGVLWGQQGASTNGVPAFDANHLNFLESVPTPAIFSAGTLNRTGIFAQLQALIQNNQLRVLANPTLMTKSGFEASFLVGGEIPYPTPSAAGQAPGVEFKKYGVALKILPQITPRNTIEAQINVGVSNPDTSVAIQIAGISVPGLSAREAVSKVEVNDGETVVLAGIKQSRRSVTITKVPILGSIPLIGLLFRNKDEEVTQTSLVFFVTFRLVKS